MKEFKRQLILLVIFLILASLLLLLLSSFAWAHPFEVKPSSSLKTAKPKEFVTYVFTVSNIEDVKNTYKLSITLPEGWSNLGIPSSIEIPPNKEEKVFVTVAVPSTAQAGQYFLKLNVTFQKDPEISYSATAIVEVSHSVGVEVKTLSGGRSVKSGTKISYPFLIRNRGNSPDQFKLTASSRHDWKLVLAEKEIKLDPGEQKTISVIVHVPYRTSVTDWLSLKATSTTSPEACDAATVFTTAISPASFSVGGLSKQVLARIGVQGFGPLTKEGFELEESSLYFNTGGLLVGNYWFNFDTRVSDIANLGNTSDTTNPKNPSFTLDFGTDRWDLSLGDTQAKFTRFTELQGRGGRAYFMLGISELTLFRARQEERDCFGGRLTKELGNSKLGLTYTHSWGDENKFSQSDRIYSLSLEHSLSEDWPVWGEYASSLSNKKKDEAWTVGSSIDSDRYFLKTSYLRAGTNFAGTEKDKQGANLAAAYRPSTNLSFGLSLSHLRDNVNQILTSPTTTTDTINLYSSFAFKGLSSVRLGFEAGKEKSKGPPPHTDLEEEAVSLGITSFWGPLFFSSSAQVGKKWNKIERWSADLLNYGAKLRLGVGRLSTWLMYMQDREQRVGEETKEKSIEKGLGLEYQLIPDKLSTLLSWREEIEDKGEQAKTAKQRMRLEIKTRLNILRGTSLSLYAENVHSDSDKGEWKAGFTLGSYLNLPIPFIKTKGAIRGTVFVDKNYNGEKDTEEIGVADLILSANGNLAMTNEKGRFAFPPLEPGEYQLGLREAPPGFTPSLSLPYKLEVKEGEIIQLDIPLIKQNQIVGVVFEDKNKNGRREPGEWGIPEVRLVLLGSSPSEETFTNPNGRFSFTVKPGKYRVIVDKSVLPERYVLTTAEEFFLDLEDKEQVSIDFGAARKERKIIITFSSKKK